MTQYELPLEQMVLGSGLFVQVNASFISVTSRRKSCLIFFFSVGGMSKSFSGIEMFAGTQLFISSLLKL